MKRGHSPLDEIAKCLYERYRVKYARRYIRMHGTDGVFSAVIKFMFATAPYKSYMAVSFGGAIIVEERELMDGIVNKADKTWRFKEIARIEYADPQMQEKLDAAIADVISRTPRLEMVQTGGPKGKWVV